MKKKENEYISESQTPFGLNRVRWRDDSNTSTLSIFPDKTFIFYLEIIFNLLSIILIHEPTA